MVFLGLVAGVFGSGFFSCFGAVCFPGVFRFSGFSALRSLASCISSLEDRSRALPELTAAMDPALHRPCNFLSRVSRLLLGVVPGTRRCTAAGFIVTLSTGRFVSAWVYWGGVLLFVYSTT